MEIQFLNPSGKPQTPNVDALGNVITSSATGSGSATNAAGTSAPIVTTTITIAAGGTAQTLFGGANPNRKGFFIQNTSGQAMWIKLGGTAANGNDISLPSAGTGVDSSGGLNCLGIISVWCNTTGAKLAVAEL